MKKIFLVPILILSIVFSLFGCTKTEEKQQEILTNMEIIVNDNKIDTSKALKKEEVYMVPLIPISVSLGYKVTRSGDEIVIEDGEASYTILLKDINHMDSHNVAVEAIAEPVSNVEDEEISLKIRPVELDNMIYVYTDFFKDVLEADVTLDKKNSRVSVNKIVEIE